MSFLKVQQELRLGLSAATAVFPQSRLSVTYIGCRPSSSPQLRRWHGCKATPRVESFFHPALVHPKIKLALQLKCCKKYTKGSLCCFSICCLEICEPRGRYKVKPVSGIYAKLCYLRPRWVWKWCSFYQLLIYDLTKLLQQVRTELGDDWRQKG